MRWLSNFLYTLFTGSQAAWTDNSEILTLQTEYITALEEQVATLHKLADAYVVQQTASDSLIANYKSVNALNTEYIELLEGLLAEHGVRLHA